MTPVEPAPAPAPSAGTPDPTAVPDPAAVPDITAVPDTTAVPGAAGLTHPRRDLDELLTHAVRFSVVAALSGVLKAEFGAVRDSVEITTPMLSKQVALLEKAGYVEVEKGRVGRRPCTWLSLSTEGSAAYARHVAALRAIAGLDH